MRVFTFLVVVSFVIPFSLADDWVNPYEEKLLWLETADVVADVKKAIKNNDLRIKCVYGFSLSCPGIKNFEGLEYSAIEGTTDGVTSDKHEELIDLAREYARIYNEYIVEAQTRKNAQ